ncbi:MAG TPA: dUTP diphosphatase [bacterium]|nr:dUTP diphosphatase [bacterium]
MKKIREFEKVPVEVRVEPGCDDLPLPRYQTSGSAGLDLSAAVHGPVILKPGRHDLIPTGIRLAIPPGYEGQIRPRSGLALERGIGVLNAPGTIDSDYRGPVGVILFNFGTENFIIHRGDRIAQLVLCRVAHIQFLPVRNLPDSSRQSGGFGSTGLNHRRAGG